MSTQEELLTLFDQRFEKYLIERKRCKMEFSYEVIHDLRVATRRLLVFLDFIREINPHPRLKSLRRNFKDQLDSLDDLRDTQVMLADFSEMIESLPELVPLLKSLTKREKRLIKAAEIDIREFKLGVISGQMEKVRAELAEQVDAQYFFEQLLSVVDSAYSTVMERKDQVDPLRSATIHHVRLAFKKFRYMLEIIHPFLPGFPAKDMLKNYNDYQTAMGEIQDTDIILQAIVEFETANRNDDLQSARLYYERHRVELVNAYVENMNEFVTFWRKRPDTPFPWEPQQKKDKP